VPLDFQHGGFGPGGATHGYRRQYPQLGKFQSHQIDLYVRHAALELGVRQQCLTAVDLIGSVFPT
jgi:hypothetical protein